MTAEWIDLKCHPAARTEAVRAIAVNVRRSVNELRVTYRLDGDISQIAIPQPAAPRIGKELWRHTCFEVFVAIEGQGAYHEINFSPSREWTVYAFNSYRDGGPLTDAAMSPDITVRCTDSRLELDAVVRLDRLSATHSRALLHVGLSVVIEAVDGFFYWALWHPADKPDFHQADGFALRLEPPKHV
jgi:hypothetical protein